MPPSRRRKPPPQIGASPVPELAKFEAPHIHAAWRAPEEALARAGVILGKTYPRPIVDHAAARARALAAFSEIRRTA